MSENKGSDDSLNIEESITSSFRIFESLYDSNDFDDSLAQTERYADQDIYHSALRSQLLMLKSGLTLKEEDINIASESAVKTAELCDKYRRRGLMQNFMKILRTPDYNTYTEIEMHAELTFAMIMAFSAFIGLLKCHSIVDLIRIINRLRLSRNAYKECRLMYETRKHWESETSRINFEAGIRLERGFRHLLISFYPPRILKFMNFLGQRGIRSVGFSEIHKTAFELTGIYSKLAEFALMGYHLYVEVLGNIGKKQFLSCNTIIEKGLEKHPNSIVYKIFSAKSAQMNGEIDRSIKEFEQIFVADNEIFHKFSHWALVWSYALKCDWDQCIKHSELLRKQALHTPAIFTYCSAIFRYFKSYETNDEILKAEATQLFKTIPSLRIGYMGKGSTFEKATIVCANKYLENKEFLFLPVIEMLYNGNIYYFIDGKVELVEPHLAIVEKELKAHLKDLVTTNYIDYYLDALFFKGVLLKHMGRLSEAQNCFNAVLNAKDRIQEMKFIIPHTLLELGLIEMLLNNTEESKVFLNRALSEFTGYMTENLVHLKAYSALRELGVNTDNEHQIETNIVNEYSHRMRAENKCENNNNLIEILRL